MHRFRGLLAPLLAAIAVLAIYSVIAGTAVSELGSRTAGEDYYNRLADGLAHGRLSLDLPVPAWLAQLPNPYDPAANAPFQGQRYSPGRIHDLSYYRGRLYLYFSVVPAVTLFLPCHLLTGAYLSHQDACLVFCGLGFLASSVLLELIRRRCFPSAGPVLAGLGTLAAGLVPLVPLVLERADVWEVPITASYGFWMLSLLLTWIALDRPVPSWPWLLGLSTAVGLAVGCRPNTCLGAALLLIPLWPVLQAFQAGDRRRGWAGFASLVLPCGAIAAGLLAYNQARFGSFSEFGIKYQLSGGNEESVQRFSLGFWWYDFRVYFLEYPGWQRVFPFVREALSPPLPVNHRGGDNPVGILTLLPFLLCVGALPFVFSRRWANPRPQLAAGVTAILIVFAANAGPLCLFFSTCLRYQLEFAPALGLLAVLGFYSLASPPGQKFPVRQACLGAAGAAAAFSIAFSLLMTANLRGKTDAGRGLIAAQAGRADEAIVLYQQALRLRPATTIAQVGLADIFAREEKFGAAASELQKAIRLQPDSAALRLNDAYCLYRLGRLDAAEAEAAAALRLQPDFPAAREAEREIQRARAPR